MQITIFYFSGTGNTWWCAQEMQKQFTKAHVDCIIVSIEQIIPERVKSLSLASDIIGIGYPVYGSDLPQPMKNFIDHTLPDNPEGKTRFFTFCTQLIFSGDGAHVYREELQKKQWNINWSVHLHMPSNICVTAMPLPYTNDPKKISKRLVKTEKKIGKFTQAISTGRSYQQGNSKASKRLGLLQRSPYRRYFPRLRNDVTIDYDACIGCNLCIRICPSGNLFADGVRIGTRGTCMLCVRCYNFCPTQAIIYMGKKHKKKRGIPYQGPTKDFSPEQIRNVIKTEE